MRKFNLMREEKFSLRDWWVENYYHKFNSGWVIATFGCVFTMGMVAYAESDRTFTVDKLECDDRTVVGWVSKNENLYSYQIGDVEKSVPMVNCTRSINSMDVRKSEMYERMKTQTPIGMQ